MEAGVDFILLGNGYKGTPCKWYLVELQGPMFFFSLDRSLLTEQVDDWPMTYRPTDRLTEFFIFYFLNTIISYVHSSNDIFYTLNFIKYIIKGYSAVRISS